MPLSWGTGQSMSPGAPAGDQFDLERVIPKGPILSSKGQESFLATGANPSTKRSFYTEKREISIFCGCFSFSKGPLEL